MIARAIDSLGAWLLSAIYVGWLKLEYRWHLADAYLARQRGENAIAADCDCRAYACQRELSILNLNRRYGAMK